jgi:hypothetical protein
MDKISRDGMDEFLILLKQGKAFIDSSLEKILLIADKMVKKL